jgi:flavodoxin I
MSADCLIVYASMTGNTEELATLIGEGIQRVGASIEIKDILEVDTSELEDYEGILLGAYTWGDGELPDEFLDFYQEMDGLNLAGKVTAVFGSCDSAYEHYGGAVDILSEKLLALGGEVVLNGLKIEHAPDEFEKELCIRFGRDFGKILLVKEEKIS